jgi:hypothetical protein
MQYFIAISESLPNLCFSLSSRINMVPVRYIVAALGMLCAAVEAGSTVHAPEDRAVPTSKAGVCRADNCARAVTGTRRGPNFPATARSDCASFLAVTVTAGSEHVSADVAAPTKSIPKYASACSGAARYTSACSCYGIKPSTVTITPVRRLYMFRVSKTDLLF